MARQYKLKRVVGVVVLSPSRNKDKHNTVTSFRLKWKKIIMYQNNRHSNTGHLSIGILGLPNILGYGF